MWWHYRSASSVWTGPVVALLAYALTSALAGPQRHERPRVAVAPALTLGLTIDGELSEWENLPAITLDSASHLLTDSALYDGNADLSGAIHFVWDSLYLYAAGRFADDCFAVGAAWTSDRVNFVFDFRNDNHPLSYGGTAPGGSSWQPDDSWVYAHIVGDGQPPYPVMRLAYDYHGPIDGALLVSRGVEGGWTFEMRVPWVGLPESQPFVGAVFGFQMFVSDGDESGRLTEIMWSERWGYSRDAGLQWELWKLGKLVLTGAPLAQESPEEGV